MYCALCRRPVEARRHIGGGTVILAVLTAGLSLVALPFYAKRCAICKGTALSVAGPEARRPPAELARVEERLRLIQDALESATDELERVRQERDFYRQLLENPEARKGRET